MQRGSYTKQAALSGVFIKQLNRPMVTIIGRVFLIVSMQQHLRLPLTRELSAKLTEGENYLPPDQCTHIHHGNSGQYPNCKFLLLLTSWMPNHLCAFHLSLLAPAYSALRRQVRRPVSPWRNKSQQYNYQSFFVFESELDDFVRNHTTIFAPKVSYFSVVLLPEGYSLCCSLSFSLPPSKIKDFCHLPHQREATEPHITHYTERCIEVRP